MQMTHNYAVGIYKKQCEVCAHKTRIEFERRKSFFVYFALLSNRIILQYVISAVIDSLQVYVLLQTVPQMQRWQRSAKIIAFAIQVTL